MKNKTHKSRTGLLLGFGSILLTVTVTGLVVANQINKHKEQSDISENEWNQTYESLNSAAEIEAYRNDAIEDIDDLYHQLSGDAQDEQASYVESQENLIREASTMENVRKTREETLAYLSSVQETDVSTYQNEAQSGESESEPSLQRIRYSADGREYTPYASVSDWDSASEEKKESYMANTVPVLQDLNQTIDSICTDSVSRTSRSYILGRQLYSWCEKQGIVATEGEYLAYRSYIGQGKESFYVELNDSGRTLIVCQSISHGLYWKFTLCEESRESVEKLREQEQADRKD